MAVGKITWHFTLGKKLSYLRFWVTLVGEGTDGDGVTERVVKIASIVIKCSRHNEYK